MYKDTRCKDAEAISVISQNKYKKTRVTQNMLMSDDPVALGFQFKLELTKVLWAKMKQQQTQATHDTNSAHKEESCTTQM